MALLTCIAKTDFAFTKNRNGGATSKLGMDGMIICFASNMYCTHWCCSSEMACFPLDKLHLLVMMLCMHCLQESFIHMFIYIVRS